MKLITNETELRRYIPNAFTTVKGETPLLQKLRPYIESAEQWHTSPTAALFTPPTFKNKKESKGYWF